MTPAERATGSTGSTQGESAVAAPATNANAIRAATARTLAGADYESLTALAARKGLVRNGVDTRRLTPIQGGGPMRWIALVALVVASAVLAASCGGDDANGNTGRASQPGAAMKERASRARRR